MAVGVQKKKKYAHSWKRKGKKEEYSTRVISTLNKGKKTDRKGDMGEQTCQQAWGHTCANSTKGWIFTSTRNLLETTTFTAETAAPSNRIRMPSVEAEMSPIQAKAVPTTTGVTASSSRKEGGGPPIAKPTIMMKNGVVARTTCDREMVAKYRDRLPRATLTENRKENRNNLDLRGQHGEGNTP